jgi:hypothetical protein
MDFEDEFVGGLSLKERIYFEWSCEISGNSVVHNDELSFWWADLECFVSQKLIMLD